MKATRASLYGVVGAASLLLSSRVVAQVTINEFVDDERTASAGQVFPDTREFVELYNAGGSAVDISGWRLQAKQLGTNFGLDAGVYDYTVPASTSIAAGGYYVIGAAGVPNVNFTPTFPTGKDMLPDGAAGSSSNGNYVLELRNSALTLIDAIADETFRGTERANLTDEQRAQTGGGWWGQDPSFNVSSPNLRFSQGRFVNGADTNVNGRDFGMLPLTPGASNNLPQNAVHTIPNVDSAGLEDPVTQYYASFVMPRAIDPTNGDGNAINPTAIAASPQGGKAIIAYDETGGGNAIYSKELVHKFDLYAYIETGPLNRVTATSTQRSEASAYGLGTTDGLFGTPNQAGLLTNTSTQNGSTGVGWIIQRVENYNGGSPTNQVVLQLVDFGDGGDSMPADHEWEVMKSYDLTGLAAGWHRLSIEQDPVTGVITAKNDGDTTVFSLPNDFNNDLKVDAQDYVAWRKGGTLKNESEAPGTVNADDYAAWKAHFGDTTKTGVIGTFYVGYRDNLGGVFTTSRPPTFDMIGGPGAGSLVSSVPEPSTIGLAVIGIFSVLAGRRRRVG